MCLCVSVCIVLKVLFISKVLFIHTNWALQVALSATNRVKLRRLHFFSEIEG